MPNWPPKTGSDWTIYGAAIVIVLILVLAVSGSGGSSTVETSRPGGLPTINPRPTDEPPTRQAGLPAPAELTQADLDQISGMVRAFFTAYSAGDIITALRYVPLSATQACGGATNHAFAYAQLLKTERTKWVVTNVTVYNPPAANGVVSVDVKFDWHDLNTGKYETSITLGFEVIWSYPDNRYLFTGDPIKQVTTFCPRR